MLYTLHVRGHSPVKEARLPVSPALRCVLRAQIFNRQGTPLFYREWSRPLAAWDVKEEHKLMFGFLFSLKQLVGKMSPRRSVTPICAVLRPWPAHRVSIR